MNRNDQDYIISKIRTAYTPKQKDALDELRALDAQVRRPVQVFSYIFGSISAIIMGAGMSLVMTDIASILGIPYALPIGITVGVVGMILAIVNYPLHAAILGSRKKKYAPAILALSEKLSKGE